MNKILSITLVLIISCFAVGCEKNNEQDTSSLVVSVEDSEVVKLAETGEIGNVEYKINDAIDTIFDDYDRNTDGSLKENVSEDIDRYFNAKENNGVSTIDTGKARYYYKTDNKNMGVTCIADYNDAYDFHVGYAYTGDVRKMVGIEPKEEKIVFDPNSSTAVRPPFYKAIPVETVYMISYQIDKYILSFYFEKDLLTATVLYDSVEWSDYEQ